jgi:hypothetical protein
MDAPPKYSRPEFERRFHVIAERLPPLDPATARLIEDRYVDGGRLRLRRMSGGGAETVHKFCKKYGGGPGEPIVNIYLCAAEYAVLAALPGRALIKRRFFLDVAAVRFGVDLFQHPHTGLMLCEVEAESQAALDRIVLPAWVGAEVTGDPDFTGAVLAGH